MINVGNIYDYKSEEVKIEKDSLYVLEDQKSYLEYDKEYDQYTESDAFCKKMSFIKLKLLEKTSLALMDCYVISSPDKPIIGTQALDTCYGILFYNRHTKKGICGHAAPSRLTSLLTRMINCLGDEQQTIEYMIVPGFRNEDRRDYS